MILLLACSPGTVKIDGTAVEVPVPHLVGDTAPPESDADTDADSDADTDTDTDSDTDAEPTGTTATTGDTAPEPEPCKGPDGYLDFLTDVVSNSGTTNAGQWTGPGWLCEVECDAGTASWLTAWLATGECTLGQVAPPVEVPDDEFVYLCIESDAGPVETVYCRVHAPATTWELRVIRSEI